MSLKVHYHIEHGHAQPHERRAVFRQGTETGGYLTQRGRFRGGEEVARLIITSTRRDGFSSHDTLTFRNELHARAWLGIIERHTR